MNTLDALTAFFIALLIFKPFSSLAASTESPQVRIFTTSSNYSSTGNLIEVHNGDILENRSQFRIEIVSKFRAHVTLTFHGSGGKHTNLVTSHQLEAGMRAIFPGADKWYSLDENPGTETVVAKFENENGTVTEVTHKINHIEDKMHREKISKLLAHLDSREFAKAVNAPLPSLLGKLDVATLNKVLNEAVASADALERLRLEEPLLVRGTIGAAVYKAASPAVVLIVTDKGIGSGSIINADGSVLTNWHVVEDYKTVAVIFKPALGKKIQPTDVYQGIVTKVDAIADLALLKVVHPPKGLKVLSVGKMSDIEVGSDVHAIGHPTGESWTYTKGIISQIRPNYEWETSNELKHHATVIQTQTPINPGSSGGPLLTDSAVLIGVNTFLIKAAQGLNFAVSAGDVQSFLTSKKSRLPMPVSTKPGRCIPRRVEKDTDGNGVVDTILIDTNCDGKPDLILVDSDENGKSDEALVDRNFDGKFDTKIIPSKKDGPLDVWLFDTDGDGKPDIVGLDTDLDGNPDRFKHLSRRG